MFFCNKNFVLVLSLLTFFNYSTYSSQFDHFKENKDPQTRKRSHDPSGSDDSSYKIKKRKLSQDVQRLPYRSQDRDRQFRDLTRQSAFIEGDICAKLRWVENLAIFCEGEVPLSYIEIGAEIHNRLAYVGNTVRAFAETYPEDSRFSFQRNILIPYVSFVVKRSNGDSRCKEFIKGGYLTFSDDNAFPVAFMSGLNSKPWRALRPYNAYRRNHNALPKNRDLELPSITIMSGKEVQDFTGKDYAPLAQVGVEQAPHCNAHTEEWFYEMLSTKPEAIVKQAKDVLFPGDKLIHVIFDLYSWFDVCRDCQTRFRVEYFKGNFQKKIEEEFENEGFHFSKRTGILPVFRVSSTTKYHSDSLANMTGAGGGSQVHNGFEAKVLSQTQVVLSTRKATDEFNYEAVKRKVTNYIENPSGTSP